MLVFPQEDQYLIQTHTPLLFCHHSSRTVLLCYTSSKQAFCLLFPHNKTQINGYYLCCKACGRTDNKKYYIRASCCLCNLTTSKNSRWASHMKRTQFFRLSVPTKFPIVGFYNQALCNYSFRAGKGPTLEVHQILKNSFIF